LLLDAFHHGVRQHAAHRSHDAVAVQLGGSLRVDFQRRQALDRWNGRDVVADLDAEHLTDVGRRVGAHQQHAVSGLGQSHGGRAGQRGLAHAAFAGEKEKARGLVQKQHDALRSQQQRLPVQQAPTEGVAATAVMPAQRAMSSREG